MRKIFFFVVFFLWVLFLLIYIREWTRAAGASLGCWVLGAGCSSANWWRIVAPFLGVWPFQFLEGWPAGALVVDRGERPSGWARVECHKLTQCASVQGMCANVQSLGRVQMCRASDVCKCADVQTFAGDVCKYAGRRVQMCRDSRTFANLNVCKSTYKLSARGLTRGVLTKFVKPWQFVTVYGY